MIINMAAEIIHSAGYINKLPVTEAFTHFFYRAMNVAKMGFHFFDGFPIERNYKMQYAMRSRVLRPNVDDHFTFGGGLFYYFGCTVQFIVLPCLPGLQNLFSKGCGLPSHRAK